jgi:hypothetical protein
MSKYYGTPHGHIYVPLSLCNSVRDQVLKITGELIPVHCYTLKQLCGEKYWLGLKTSGNRTKAGLAMAELVRTGKLPLVFAGKDGATWLYALAKVTH